MTQTAVGAACVVDSATSLIGLISESDLPKHLLSHENPLSSPASELMNPDPTTVEPDLLAIDAFEVEGRQATYSGVGTLNGRRGFAFVVSVVDGRKGAPDRFSIKIWRIADGAVVYDSQLSDVQQGEIVIHRES